MSAPDETSYAGRHAELYDLFYAEKPYAEEAAFVDKCIQTRQPGAVHLLELACGTGTHSLLLEKRGYKIVATDYSPYMLAQAREKARASHSSVDFRQQDMRALNLPETSFDAAICLFDSLGYVATNQNITKVLNGIHKKLVPGGIFIFEFWHAGAMIRAYDPARVKRFDAADSRITRISETTIDYQKQLCRVQYTIYETDSNGTCQVIHETQTNRFFLVQEMALFLENAGFEALAWHDGFTESQQIDDSTWHILGVARKIRNMAS